MLLLKADKVEKCTPGSGAWLLLSSAVMRFICAGARFKTMPQAARGRMKFENVLAALTSCPSSLSWHLCSSHLPLPLRPCRGE